MKRAFFIALFILTPVILLADGGGDGGKGTNNNSNDKTGGEQQGWPAPVITYHEDMDRLQRILEEYKAFEGSSDESQIKRLLRIEELVVSIQRYEGYLDQEEMQVLYEAKRISYEAWIDSKTLRFDQERFWRVLSPYVGNDVLTSFNNEQLAEAARDKFVGKDGVLTNSDIAAAAELFYYYTWELASMRTNHTTEKTLVIFNAMQYLTLLMDNSDRLAASGVELSEMVEVSERLYNESDLLMPFKADIRGMKTAIMSKMTRNVKQLKAYQDFMKIGKK